MKLRILSLSLTAALVMIEYPLFQASQAQPPVQVAQSIWKNFTSTEGSFTVLMPGTPKKESYTAKTQVGPVNTQAFGVERKQEGVVYIVAYSDFPDQRVQSANPQKLFDGAQDGGLRSSQSKLLSQRHISLNGYPGRELKLVNPKGQIAKLRMYLVNGRLYQVIVITTQQNERNLSGSIEGFLNSFKLLPR